MNVFIIVGVALITIGVTWLFKSRQNRDRYFIINYTAKIGNSLSLCMCTYETNNGQFVNREIAVERLLQINSEFEQVYISNILEISQKDFNTWNTTSKKLN